MPRLQYSKESNYDKEVIGIIMTDEMTHGNGKKSFKEHAKRIFTTKNITRMAIFTALAYLLYMPIFEFSLIPAVPFLKVDFSNAFVMMAGFALGPISGIIVGVLKELLHAVTFSQTVGVGELANIIIMLPFVLIPSIVYKRRRNIKTVLITLAIACVAQAVWSVPVNYLLTFPFFLMAYAGAPNWTVGMDFYLSVWYWAVIFNFVKVILISAAVLLLYKQFQRLFDYMFANDRKRKKHAAEQAVAADGANEQKHEIRSPEDMEKLGESLASELAGGEVVLLSGELGAGKTVFCKGLARGLSVGAEVVSPTFTLMNEYLDGRIVFRHFDAYRLSGADEALGAGIAEYFGQPDCVCAVEWWENVRELFDGIKTIRVDIKKTDDGRVVTVLK